MLRQVSMHPATDATTPRATLQPPTDAGTLPPAPPAPYPPRASSCATDLHTPFRPHSFCVSPVVDAAVAPACRPPDARCGHVSAVVGNGSCAQLVVAGGYDHFGKTFTDVWVLALESGAWGRLPSVGEGLRGMSVCELMTPQPARGEAAALLLVGAVSLQDSADKEDKAGCRSTHEESRAFRGVTLAKSDASLTPDQSQGSMSSIGPGDAKLCLALCSLERQVREKGSMSPRTLALGHSLWSPTSPRSALESALVTRGLPASNTQPLPTQRLLNFENANGGAAGTRNRADLPSDCYAGSPWSRCKRNEERHLELARELIRESDDVTRAVPLDARRHLGDWQALIGALDVLVAQLASAGAAGHVDADGNPTSLQDYARLVHQQLAKLRDEAEARLDETRGMLLLAESPLTDILAAESGGHPATSARSRSTMLAESGAGGGGDAVLRRQLQVLQVKVQADKRRLLASEIEMLKSFSTCLSEAVHGQRAVRWPSCAFFCFYLSLPLAL